MCLMVMAYECHPRYRLILASNRDEFLARPALPAHFWDDPAGLLAGRDVEGGGTWLGITRTARFALLTNHRDLREPLPKGRSRGLLVRDTLQGMPPDARTGYEGFNLIHGPIGRLRYLNNIDGSDHPLGPGVHALSNALLNTPWPKTIKASTVFRAILQDPEPGIDRLFDLLRDETRAEDAALPDTGIGVERERALSPIFIRSDGYGTRCSTVITVDAARRVHFEERTHDTAGRVVHEFTLEDP